MTTYSRRQLYSVLIAALFWTVTVAGMKFIPLDTAVEEPVYKEIHIQLAPLEEKAPEPVQMPEPVVEEVAVTEPVPPAENIVAEPAPAAPAPAKTAEPAPKAAEPAAPKKAEPAKTVTPEPAQAPAAKTPTPAPEPAKQTLVKSVDQLMAEQAASKGTKKKAEDVDWDALFGESSTATSTTSSGEKTFAAQTGSALSGSAAASSSVEGSSASATSGKATDTSVSAGTTSALDNIGSAAGNAVSGGSSRGSASGVEGGTGSASGGASDGSGIEWGSGVGRKLINPSKPGIAFTDEQKALITASVRDIRISFKVRKDGNVLRESIMIDKKASLPSAISQEIERQISEWRFETGTSDGQAVFLYSIIKE